jgi:diguanylate cyclase (GGDEF)-like protein/PAS domain S-box-containing protein
MSSILRTKRLLWGIIFGLMTVMGWLSYVSGQRYLHAAAWVEHTLQVQSALDASIAAVQEAEDTERGFLLTSEASQLHAYHAAQALIPQLLARLSSLTHDNAAQQARGQQLAALVTEKLSFIEDELRLELQGQHTAVIAVMRGGRGIALMNRIRELGSEMFGEERRLLELRKAEAARMQRQAVLGIGLGSALTITLSLLSLLSVHRDVETLRRAAEELAASEAYFRLITETSSDLVRTQDLDGKTLYVSPSVERILGYTPKELLAFAPLDLVHPDDLEIFKPSRKKPISERYKHAPLEYRLRHKDGSYRWLEINFGSLRDGSGKIIGVQSAARDVTERRLAEQRLAEQAEELRSLSLRDELTGLFNRRGWLELASQGMRLAVREKRAAAVIFGDLNGMKQINDQHGHEEGDRALRDTARVLLGACREVDVIARFGGDEFVVFALDFDAQGLAALRTRARAQLGELNHSGTRPFHLSLSLGAAFYHPDRPETLPQLLERADAEMYERKRARRENGGMSLPPPSH